MGMTLLLLAVGLPLLVVFFVALDTRLSEGAFPTRAKLIARLRSMTDGGMLSNSENFRFSTPLRLWCWLTTLAIFLAELYQQCHNTAIAALIACGALELLTLAAGVASKQKSTAAESTWWQASLAWLAIVGSLAAVGSLYGTLDASEIAAAQAAGGLWTILVLPAGSLLFFLGAALCLIPVRGAPRDVELLQATRAITLSLATLLLYCGGWHFWGISTYTTGNELSAVAAGMCGVVILLKWTILLSAAAWFAARRVAGWSRERFQRVGGVLGVLLGVSLLTRLVLETWIATDDKTTRVLLAWIAAAGLAVYGLMFHSTILANARRGLTTKREPSNR